MNVEQSPLLKEFQADPKALRALLSRLIRPAPEKEQQTVKLNETMYTILRSPAITKELATAKESDV